MAKIKFTPKGPVDSKKTMEVFSKHKSENLIKKNMYYKITLGICFILNLILIFFLLRH